MILVRKLYVYLKSGSKARGTADHNEIFCLRNQYITIGHFTVMDGREGEVGLVLIQTFPAVETALLCKSSYSDLTLTSIFQGQFT